jgi:hypothetical protein
MIMRRLVALGCLLGLLWGSPALAEVYCWTLPPFADTLMFDAVQPLPAQPHYLLFAEWDGAGVYTLGGGGTATGSFAGDVVTAHLVLHNPQPQQAPFFNGNPVCNLSMTLDVATLSGHWALVCEASSFENPPYEVAGQIQQSFCGVEALRQFRGRLAGVR